MTASLETLAALVQRLAVLLSAGVPPTAAWGYLGDGATDVAAGPGAAAPGTTVSDGRERLRRSASGVPESRRGPAPAVLIAAEIARGSPVADAVAAVAARESPGESPLWRALAAAWAVATEAGAPLAPALRAFAVSLRALAQAEREVRVALAGPIATARIVMVLPPLGLLFGLALGFDTLTVLFTTPLGLGCLVGGAALLLLARWWNRRLVAAARPASLTPGIRLDLMAIAASGGAAFDRARAVVDLVSTRFDLGSADDAVIDAVLELSRRAGVPAAELLRSEAAEARLVAVAEAQRRAAALAVRLMLPLGTCVLPAFLLLGVAPLMIAVISSTVGSF